MTLSLNCKEAGDPTCTHTMYGETQNEVANVYLSPNATSLIPTLTKFSQFLS